MATTPKRAALQHFVDALRNALDLEPLYSRSRVKTVEEKFYRSPAPFDDIDRNFGRVMAHKRYG